MQVSPVHFKGVLHPNMYARVLQSHCALIILFRCRRVVCCNIDTPAVSIHAVKEDIKCFYCAHVFAVHEFYSLCILHAKHIAHTICTNAPLADLPSLPPQDAPEPQHAPPWSDVPALHQAPDVDHPKSWYCNRREVGVPLRADVLQRNVAQGLEVFARGAQTGGHETHHYYSQQE